MADFTDVEIRNILKSHGENIGPITPSTREIYLRKIRTLQKSNNTSTKTNRKSEPIISKKSDFLSSRTTDFHPSTPEPDTQYIVNGTPNRDAKATNTTPPRNIYGNLINISQNNSKFASSKRVPEPTFHAPIDRFPSRNYEQNSYSDSDFQKIAEESHMRELHQKHISPITYSYPPNDRGFQRSQTGRWTATPTAMSGMSYSVSDSMRGDSQMNTSNRIGKWYNGSLRTLSSYLGSRKERDDLMDISDCDLSDNEGALMTKLRKNYFKKSPSADIDNSKKQAKPEKKSELSFISLNQFPNILLIAFIVFSVLVFGSYLMMKSRYSHLELDISIDRLVCKSDQQASNGNIGKCFTASEIPQLRNYLRRLYDILSEYSGKKTCEFASDKRISFSGAKEMLNYRLKQERQTDISDLDWSKLMQLVINLPRDKLRLVGYGNDDEIVGDTGLPEDVTYLEGLNPKLSILCRMQMAAASVISWATYLIFVLATLAALVVVAYCLNVYRLKQKELDERVRSELRDIVSSISGLLQDQARQAEYNSTCDKFLSLVKIRSILQQTYPKLRENKFWDQVKKFMYKNEPLIEMREIFGHGEILQWKCRAGWQGSAVQSDCQVKFEKGPTECLKIRNMNVQHDRFDETGKNYLCREVMNRIKDAGEVKDIKFLTKGPNIIVYVLCASREVAGKAFQKINANYFNGNLLSVKFIRLDKYLARFPESKIYVQ